MIYFIDQTSEEEHHLVFNSSMVKVIHRAFPDEAICYYGLASSIMSVRSMLSADETVATDFINIRHGKIYTNNKILKALNYIRKELFRVRSFIKILNRSNKNDWIILSITTFTSFLWFKILKVFYKTNTIAVLHGEVTFLYKATSSLERLDAFAHKLIFNIKAPGFYYLVLNKIEKQILVQDGYLKSSEVLEIEHPFSNLQDKEIRNHLSDSCVSIGHLGTLEKNTKNSHYLFLLAEKCKEEVMLGKLSFNSVGLMLPAVIPYKNKYVNVVVGNDDDNRPRYLPREEYEHNINQLDYSIFFYPPDEYIFRASGAIADTIAKCKPIICLQHPIFDYMFSNGGDIGFKCETLEEMTDLLKEMVQPEFRLEEKYKQQVDNLKRYRQKFTVENVAIDLKVQIHQLINKQ